MTALYIAIPATTLGLLVIILFVYFAKQRSAKQTVQPDIVVEDVSADGKVAFDSAQKTLRPYTYSQEEHATTNPVMGQSDGIS